jgi:hypothetical protein
MAFWNVSVELTMNGASGVVPGIFEDEPMCMHSTVSVSTQAANSGSHSPEWIDGRPRGYGFSENVMAWHPCAAQRRTSSAARRGSHSGTMARGMSRPLPSPPHHSSIIQSL